MNNTEKKRRFPSLHKNSAYNGQVSAALVGAIIGMLVGTLPAVVWALIFKSAAYPLYAIPPLAMFWFIARLRGCRDVRTLIIMLILLPLGAYLTSVFASAAAYAMSYDMSLLSVPLVAVSSIGNVELLPETASGYVFPLLFAVLGAALSWELLYYGGAASTAEAEEEDENAAE